MAGIVVVRELGSRAGAVENVDAPLVVSPAPMPTPDIVDTGTAGRLLPAGASLADVAVTGAQLARAADAPDVTGFRSLLDSYRAIAAEVDDGTPAAVMAASGNDPGRASAQYSAYLAGQRVNVPQAALLTAAGVERNADIGTVLAAYRSYVRYDGVSANAAALLANAHVRTGVDIDVIYQRYRTFADSGRSSAASAALATAEIESGNRDGFVGLAQRLRNAGFQQDDDAVVAASMLRHGRTEPTLAWGHNVDLKNGGVAPSQRPALVAAGVASGRSSSEMLAAYTWFLRNGGVQEPEAAMLAAGWAMRGGNAAGLMTTLALRNRDMRD